MSSSKRIRVHYKPIVRIENGDSQFGCSEIERYWMGFAESFVFKAQGNVTSCDFSSQLPFLLATTSGKQVTTFDPLKCELKATYSRFKEKTNSAKFRANGSLLGVATHAGELLFFDTQSESQKRHWAKNAIRTFHAHHCAVNAFDYDANGRKVFSMADDGWTKLFDLASSVNNAVPLWECKAHSDAIRTGVASAESDNILITGSYDHTVKVWDIRANTSAPVKQLDNGAPVERLLYIRNDDVLASAAGTVVTLWDLNMGKILAHIEKHNKTVTSLSLASGGVCLLSGSIDRSVNVIRLDDNGKHELVHSIRLNWPVLSLSVSPNDKFLAFGMPNRLELHRREPKEEEKEAVDGHSQGMKRKRPKDVKGFDTKWATGGGKGRERAVDKMHTEIVQTDRILGTDTVALELTEQQLDKLSLGDYDRMLRQGSFRELVGKMLRNAQASPDLVVATFGQIRIRNCLGQALSDHDKQELRQLFLFLRHNLFVASYFDILYEVATVAIDTYAGKPLQKDVRANIKLLEAQLRREVQVQEVICETIDIEEMLAFINLRGAENGDALESDEIE